MARAKEKIQHDEYDRLRAEFDTLRDDLASLAGELKSFARDKEQTLADRTNERVVALKSAGEHQLELARTYALDAAKSAEKTVREHPAYAVAGAAALGFLLGAITLRRR